MTRPYKRHAPDPDAAALLAAIAAKCALCAARVPLDGDMHTRERDCTALVERAALRQYERNRRAARSAAFAESLVPRVREKSARQRLDESMLERVRLNGVLFASTPAESRSLERLRRARLVKYQNWRRNPDWKLNCYVLRGPRKDARK